MNSNYSSAAVLPVKPLSQHFHYGKRSATLERDGTAQGLPSEKSSKCKSDGLN